MSSPIQVNGKAKPATLTKTTPKPPADSSDDSDEAPVNKSQNGQPPSKKKEMVAKYFNPFLDTGLGRTKYNFQNAKLAPATAKPTLKKPMPESSSDSEDSDDQTVAAKVCYSI